MRAWIVGLSALALVGIVLALVGDGTLDVIAIMLVGIAAVGAVSLGFFAVGRSEDEARAAEQAPDGPNGRLESRRPPRSRGDQ